MIITYLCANAIRSAALPVPSQTTTGTGGVSVTYSRTARMVLVPPSMTSNHTKKMVREKDAFPMGDCTLTRHTSGVEKFAESLCVDMNFSSFLLRAISAPYFPTVPLSTRRK